MNSVDDRTEHSVANIVDLQNEVRSESIQAPDRLMINDPNIQNEVQSSSVHALTGMHSALTNHSLEKVNESNSETDKSEQLHHNLRQKVTPANTHQMRTQTRFVKNALVKSEILVEDQNANDTD